MLNGVAIAKNISKDFILEPEIEFKIFKTKVE